MSVLDDLRAAEARVAERLKELEPAVAEYRELQAVAERLGIDAARSETPTAPRTGRSRPAATGSAKTPGKSSARRRRRGSARSGQRAEQLVELVKARPGVTVREAGAELGVDPTSLYRIVRRLEERGDVRKNGRALEPAGSGN